METIPEDLKLGEMINFWITRKGMMSLSTPEEEIKEFYEDNHHTIECKECNTLYTLQVTKEQVQWWQRGTLIQQAMPKLSAGERELFVTGICGKCFDAMFEDCDATEADIY